MLNNIRIKLAAIIQRKLQNYINGRNPDFTVGTDYLQRWWIIPRNHLFNIYYHNFRISDDDRSFHDHMYMSISIILENSYIEHTLTGKFYRSAGDMKLRLPKTLHRIEIPEGKECWTLFITGPRVRTWGFQVGAIVRNWLGFRTKSGWMPHTEYIEKYGEQVNNKK